MESTSGDVRHYIILKMGQWKIISVQISEQKIFIWFDFLIICIIGINWLKKLHRKNIENMFELLNAIHLQLQNKLILT